MVIVRRFLGRNITLRQKVAASFKVPVGIVEHFQRNPRKIVAHRQQRRSDQQVAVELVPVKFRMLRSPLPADSQVTFLRIGALGALALRQPVGRVRALGRVLQVRRQPHRLVRSQDRRVRLAGRRRRSTPPIIRLRSVLFPVPWSLFPATRQRGLRRHHSALNLREDFRLGPTVHPDRRRAVLRVHHPAQPPVGDRRSIRLRRRPVSLHRFIPVPCSLFPVP